MARKKQQQEVKATFSVDEVARLVKWSASCAAMDASRPILEGILIEITKKGGRFVTADGFRLLVLPFGDEEAVGPEEEVLGRAVIKAKTLNQNVQQFAKDYAKTGSKSFTVLLEDKQEGATFAFGAARFELWQGGPERWDKDKGDYVVGPPVAKEGLALDSIPGTFPNWRQLVPGEGYSETAMVLDTDTPAWLAAFKAGEVWNKAHKGAGIFRMQFDSKEDRVAGSMQTPSLSKDEKPIKATYDLPAASELPSGVEKKTALNVSYLRGMAEVAGSGGFTVKVKDPSAPVSFEYEHGGLLVVMPMMVRWDDPDKIAAELKSRKEAAWGKGS